MTYNLTVLKSVSSMSELMGFTNSVTNDTFSGLVVISLYIILIMSLKRYDTVQAIAASSFAMFFVSLFLRMAGLLNFMFPLFFASVVAVIMLYAFTNRT